MHFQFVPFCVALVILFLGVLAWRYADSEADSYFREGEPDYIRWTEARGMLGMSSPPSKENRSEIRRRITNRGRVMGVILIVAGLLALIMELASEWYVGHL